MFLKIKSLFQDWNQKEEKGSGMLKTKIVTVPEQLDEARNTSNQRLLVLLKMAQWSSFQSSN